MKKETPYLAMNLSSRLMAHENGRPDPDFRMLAGYAKRIEDDRKRLEDINRKLMNKISEIDSLVHDYD